MLVFVIAAVALACFTAAGQASSVRQTSAASTNVKFTLDYLYDGLHAPFFSALKQKFYEGGGLNVKIIQGAGSSISIDRVAAGQAQVGLADSSTLLTALAQHRSLNVVAVGVLLRHTPEGIGVLTSSGIKTPKQLVGKSIASSPGTSGDVLLPAFLAAVGIEKSSVKIQGVNPGASNALLYAGKVNAADNYVQTFAQSPHAVTFIPYYKSGLQVYGTAIIANKTWLGSHGADMKAFLAASARGLSYTLDSPAKAGGYVGQAAGRPAGYYVAELGLLKPYWSGTGGLFGRMTLQTWSAMSRLFQKYGHIKPVSPQTLFTNNYLG